MSKSILFIFKSFRFLFNQKIEENVTSVKKVKKKISMLFLVFRKSQIF